MATSSESPESERKRLEQTISALEAQRAILGDEAADAAIASLSRELSALEKAESEPELAYEVNALAVGQLGTFAKEAGAFVFHISI